eukprot:TRINITY_DN4359_c0_g1_i1.p1 TRINITY_DN4359_c0_g1~~TRINITY_DN4359_c0_g1_i1.p1  ORF type:complete len:415 (+),score=106.89 TRINITY_DN4359_c0_g1_i1:109-1353(+)
MMDDFDTYYSKMKKNCDAKVDMVGFNLSIHRICATAESTYREANSLMDCKDFKNSLYKFYLYAVLMLKILQKHPGMKKPENKAICDKHKSQVETVLKFIPMLKSAYREDYEKEREKFMKEHNVVTAIVAPQPSTEASPASNKITNTKTPQRMGLDAGTRSALMSIGVSTKKLEITPAKYTPEKAYPAMSGSASYIPGSSGLQVQYPAGHNSSTSYGTPASSSSSSSYSQSQSSSTEYRRLKVPQSIFQEFTNMAAPNSSLPPSGIETCGILAGKTDGDGLVVTHCIVPKQTGEQDSCTMTNEEELFEYCMTHDLMVLGWIHTHPSQDCFLSSMDVHTHCGFQVMLPEAIAIVIAPTDKHGKRVGAFRMTPEGLKVVAACEKRGFHEHPECVIYENAGHATITSDIPHTMVDMRK